MLGDELCPRVVTTDDAAEYEEHDPDRQCLLLESAQLRMLTTLDPTGWNREA